VRFIMLISSEIDFSADRFIRTSVVTLVLRPSVCRCFILSVSVAVAVAIAIAVTVAVAVFAAVVTAPLEVCNTQVFACSSCALNCGFPLV